MAVTDAWLRLGWCISVLASLAFVPRTAHAAPEMSAHQREMSLHASELPSARVLPERMPEPRDSSLERVVYGYYPFWVADLTTIRWKALTHLAWFAVEIDSAGNIDATHGWPDSEVVDVAHAADVRVDLTFTLFSSSGIQALCTSPSRRATAIDNMVTLMEDGNADGISVDFEFVNSSTREAFVTFIAELRAELDARGHSDAEISIAGPAVDWGNAIDLDALLDSADWFFVMGYGYFWSGSSHAGPLGMLRVTADWAPYQSRSMLRTIASYSRIIPADKRKQIIWGVPYYGREWRTTSGNLGASTISNLGAVTYSQAKSDIASMSVDEVWDDGVKSPWYRWQQNGSWRQVHYENVESLTAKYDLAIDQDLGGVGMWALNYDKPHEELWDLLEDSFGQLPGYDEGHRHNPIAIDTLPFHDERSTADGGSHYFNYYSCDAAAPEFGREWVYQLDVCQNGTIVAAVPEYPDRDPDLHVLSDPDQDACIDRAHTELETPVQPGRYLLVVDTYVDMPVELEGPYELDVDFVPEPGSVGCAPDMMCDAGTCVCPDGAIECDGACVDHTNHALHCGGCDIACDTGEACIDGQCSEPPTTTPPTTRGADPTVEPEQGDAGCACHAAPAASNHGFAWLAALILIPGLRRRR